MPPRGRPIGVWIATIYLMLVLALAVLYLAAAIQSGNGRAVFTQTTAVLIVLSSAISLFVLSRWTALATGLLAAFQVGSYLAYLGADTAQLDELGGFGTVVHLISISHNLTPLVFLAGTLATFLYALWLLARRYPRVIGKERNGWLS
jgi:hypothetical protein